MFAIKFCGKKWHYGNAIFGKSESAPRNQNVTLVFTSITQHLKYHDQMGVYVKTPKIHATDNTSVYSVA